MSHMDQASSFDDGSQQLLPLTATHPPSSPVHSITHTYIHNIGQHAWCYDMLLLAIFACPVNLAHSSLTNTCLLLALPCESGSFKHDKQLPAAADQAVFGHQTCQGIRRASTTKLSNAGSESLLMILDIAVVVILVNLQLLRALACCCRPRCCAAGVPAPAS